MEWIIGALILLVMITASMYWKSVRQCNQLTNFTLLILLNDEVHTAQRNGLMNLVRTIDAKNAGELGGKVNIATGHLAAKLEGTTLGVAGLLWKLKNAA